MQSFKTNDNVTLKYIDTGKEGNGEDLAKPWLVLIHGFTGSSKVWQRNIPSFRKTYRVIASDLRGHGSSEKRTHGYQVMRLAMDLRELILHLQDTEEREGEKTRWAAIGGSLGCSILWAYASLFTTDPFTHMIFVDQAPLQNSDPASGWDYRYCNRGMNNPMAVSALQTTLALSPEIAHKGTIATCLAYRSHPLPTDQISASKYEEDERFFLGEAMKGDGVWYGKLMADHTALDWRDVIKATFGEGSRSQARVLVMASSRSGCFPAEGPMRVVDLVNEEGKKRAKGVVVDWGGHWMYWEDHEKFDRLCLGFLERVD